MEGDLGVEQPPPAAGGGWSPGRHPALPHREDSAAGDTGSRDAEHDGLGMRVAERGERESSGNALRFAPDGECWAQRSRWAGIPAGS